MKQGFTLIELLVVVLIIGILSAVAVPQYQLAVDKARFTEMQIIGKKLSEMIELYYLSTGKYPDYWADLDITIPGCTETKNPQFDMTCQKSRWDLNPGSFSGWDSLTRSGKADENGSFNPDGNNFLYYHYFKYTDQYAEKFRGKTACMGVSERGKKLCKNLCGANFCYLE